MNCIEESRIKDIYACLSAAGIDTYFPTQHQGECLAPYVVVRASTTTKLTNYSSTVKYYELLCYVPLNRYGNLESFTAQVKVAMTALQPAIMPTYYESQPFYDESVKGHMVSIQYQNYRKI